MPFAAALMMYKLSSHLKFIVYGKEFTSHKTINSASSFTQYSLWLVPSGQSFLNAIIVVSLDAEL